MRRSLIQTIPRVPSNLPVFFDALVYEVIHARRLGAGQNNHFEERLPRQGLMAIIDLVGPNLPTRLNLTFTLELIPMANSVEVYLETGMMSKGILRLMRGLTEKMFDQIAGRQISESIAQLLTLEYQNYGRQLQESGGLDIQPSQTNIPLEITPTTLDTHVPSDVPPTETIYCHACGLANPANAHFCESCGTKLGR